VHQVEQIKSKLGIKDDHSFNKVYERMKNFMSGGLINLETFRHCFKVSFPEISKLSSSSLEGRDATSDNIDFLFHLFDIVLLFPHF
jgi:hypothetical protein